MHCASDLWSTPFPPSQPPVKEKKWFHTNSTLQNTISGSFYFPVTQGTSNDKIRQKHIIRLSLIKKTPLVLQRHLTLIELRLRTVHTPTSTTQSCVQERPSTTESAFLATKQTVTSKVKLLLWNAWILWNKMILDGVLDVPFVERLSKQLRGKHSKDAPVTLSVCNCFFAVSTWYGSSSGHTLATNYFFNKLSVGIADTCCRYQISVSEGQRGRLQTCCCPRAHVQRSPLPPASHPSPETAAPGSVVDTSQMFHRDWNFCLSELEEWNAWPLREGRENHPQNFCRKD